jgi:uncharacterized protein
MPDRPFKFFDSDAHVVEPASVLYELVEARWRGALDAQASSEVRTYSPNSISFARRLASHDPAPPIGSTTRFRGKDPSPDTSSNTASRIEDMDLDGIDLAMLLPSGVAAFCSLDVELELAMYRAYHRYMSEFCAGGQGRLTGVVLAATRDLDAAIAEIRRVAESEPWAVAVWPALPRGMGLDDPGLDPLWAAAAELDLTVVSHSFTTLYPYCPGALDDSFYDNAWLARSAAHPWAGQRNMAAMLGSGVLDRHPRLRYAVLEAGHGWLPYWVSRVDEQAEYMPASYPPASKKVSEYVRSGRYFQSIELHEGPGMTRYVVDEIGPDVLMFSTDYPHGESWFPRAVKTFLEWDGFTEAELRQMAWENPTRCFPRAVARS